MGWGKVGVGGIYFLDGTPKLSGIMFFGRRWLSNCSCYLIVSFLEGHLWVHSVHGFVVATQLRGIRVVRSYCEILLDYRFH